MPEPDDADDLLVLDEGAEVDAGPRLGSPSGGSAAATLISGAEAAEPGPDGAAFEELGLLGRGGAGEVWRVRDPRLDRVVALKVLRPDQGASSAAQARFVAEARVTAGLQHPGVVPVHELGRLPDGRAYFTMKEVTGRTLEAVAAEARTDPAAWPLRRLVEILRRVCEAVAYAHARGVLHRDLKPANVLVGEFGEVLVVDWGLARRAHAEVRPLPTVPQSGAVVGTPAYMAPEQAWGEPELSNRADVYALGVMLYELLARRKLRDGDDGWAVVVLARTAPVPPLGGAGVPEALAAIAARATAREPAERYPEAGALGAALGAWLDGAQRREDALAVLREAEALLPRAQALRADAARLRAAAASALAAAPPWAPEADKAAGWALQDRAAEAEREANLLRVRATERLHAALTHDADLPEAHAALAAVYRERHAEAEARRDPEAAGWALLLAAHDTGEHAAWLRGDGAISLVTDPPGATVELRRLQAVGHRLVERAAGTLGTTPLRAAPLPMGSWVLVLRAPGCHEVRYPVELRRLDHWDGVRPGDTAPTPIRLPRLGELAPDEVVVPAGWFRVGGDPEAASPHPAVRMWADAFVVRRHPVQKAEYLRFLNDLVATGREAEALRWVPRDRPTRVDVPGEPLYPRDAAGRFVLEPLDSDGDPWSEAWPVFAVDRACARAYAAWLAETTGHPWRLPHELEWEKAARGVDGRWFPWGDGFDASRCHMRDSQPGRPIPQPVGSFPVDRSPYGAADLAGCIRQWCDNDYREPGVVDGGVVRPVPGGPDSLGSLRGGFWAGVERVCRSASRLGEAATVRVNGIGLRVVRGLEPAVTAPGTGSASPSAG